MTRDELIEEASKAYAEATSYYVPFHRGLSSESSDKIRKGIAAALAIVGPEAVRVAKERWEHSPVDPRGVAAALRELFGVSESKAPT